MAYVCHNHSFLSCCSASTFSLVARDIAKRKNSYVFAIRKVRQWWCNMTQSNQASPLFTTIHIHIPHSTCLHMVRRPFSPTQGVICFDYRHDLGLLVTGSMDHSVQLWDPYVPSRPMAVLSGHASAVLDVIISRDLGLVFSCSQDCVS